MALDASHVANAGDHVGDHNLIDTALAQKQQADADLTTIAALDATVAGMLATDGSGWIKKTYAQVKTALSIGNIDNTSDVNKPVSTAQSAAITAAVAVKESIKAFRFYPESYGAVGDNATDDTTAIKNCVAAAVAYGVAHSYYAEVVFDPLKTYLVSGAHTQGGTTKGNAQIPIPMVPDTGQKLILVFSGGVVDQSAFPHWNQTVVQRSGSVIRSTSTAAYSATFGFPSIIGGPTPEQGYGHSATPLFNNICVVVDGLRVEAPNNPTVYGVDFAGIAQMKIISLVVGVTGSPGGLAGAGYTYPNQFAAGLRTPDGDNNDQNTIIDYCCEAFHHGIITAEHLSAQRMAFVYCQNGVLNGGTGAATHSQHIGMLSTEHCTNHIRVQNACPLTIGMWDIEDAGGASPFVTSNHVYDPGNILLGHAYFVEQSGGGPVFTKNGAANFVCEDVTLALGALGAVTVPASTTPKINTFWRNAAVTITAAAGSTTTVAIDGQTVGVIPASGVNTFIVPNGKAITLTYASAPTWKWTVL